ncbi:CHR11-1 protein [Spatholobus suberectus]|nr:CHR11-1 protein [Spatholobus suberectus]
MLKMRAVLASVLPLPLSHRLHTQAHNPNLHHHRFPSSFNSSTTFSNKTVVFGVKPSDSKDPSFFDEDGVVNDMEGYLNHLSLEYDSVWDTKPSWCQPWTIVADGGINHCH